MAVDFVVLVLPDGAAALAAVLGDGHRPVLVRHGAVGALHQLRVTARAAPVLLHPGAGLAHFWGNHGLGPWG